MNMKIQLLHDPEGNIRGVFARAGKRDGFLRPHDSDRLVTEIDIPKLKMKLTPKTQVQFVEALDRLLAGSKVVSGRLVQQKTGNR
jgi:hypothetical protein